MRRLTLLSTNLLLTPRQEQLLLVAAVGFLLALPACAPRPAYRPPLSSRGSPAPPVTQALPPSVREPQPRPVWEDAKIREQDIPGRELSAPSVREPARPTDPDRSAPGLPDDSSLIAKITPGTPPRRAASLRLTEEGKRLIEAGDYPKALNRLERTIAIDSTNAYGYYYLAKTHYHMARHRESLNFLDVAESRFSGEPFWLAEVYALRGENLRALGHVQQAEANYSEALRLNPDNRTAAEALARLHGERQR